MCEHTGEWCDGIFPDDPDYCAQQWADASWCAGPSVRECPDGRYIPEDHESCLPGNAEAVDGALGGSCELDGSCDDSCSPPARGDCTLGEVEIGTALVVTAPPHDVQLAELPATGVGVDVLLLVAAAMIAAGGDLLWRRRRGRR